MTQTPQIQDLVIIEAPGKRERIQRIVNRLPGLQEARVEATRGVLFNLPENRIALDPDTLLPSHFVPVHPKRVEALRKQIRQSRRVWIATDPDIEGEMIAIQIQFLLPRKHPPTVHRVRFNSLSPESITRAFANPSRTDMQQAALATARRAIDRYIGYVHSNRFENHQAGLVGRVHTRLLHALHNHPPVCAEVTGTVCRKYQVQASANAYRLEHLRQLWSALRDDHEFLAKMPTHAERRILPPPRPMTYADLILAAEKHLNLKAEQADSIMQDLYENGRLSYLRTDTHALGHSGVQSMTALAQRHGLRVDPPEPKPQGAFAHEALHPLDMDLDLRADPRDLGAPEALLALAGRALVASAMPPAKVVRHTIDPKALAKHFSNRGIEIEGLGLAVWKDTIEQAGWMRLIRPQRHPASLRWRPTTSQLIQLMLDHELGRPSTFINHARSIIRRRQVLPDGRLSAIGLAALEYAEEHTPWLIDRPDPVETMLADPGTTRDAKKMIRKMLQGFGIDPDLARREIARRTPVHEDPEAQAAATGRA